MNLYRYVSLLFAIGLAASAQAQTFTQVSLHNPTYVSGPTSGGRPLPGAVYRYTNVGRTTTANTIDAYVTFVRTSNYQNNGTTTASNLVGLHTLDVAASVNSPGGYDSAFQAVTSVSKIAGSNGIWTRRGCSSGYVEMNYDRNQNYLCHFRIAFKKGGTQTDTALSVRAAFIDIDGFGSGTEAEQNAFMPGISYALAPSTTLQMSTRPSDGMINALGRPANVGGINLTTITAITQVVYHNRTFIDFAVGMRTNDDSQNGGCYDATAGGRLSSVSFSAQPGGLTVVKSTSDTLRGTVWDDANGSGTATWTLIPSPGEPGTNGDGMWVYAIDAANNIIVDKAAVNANGTYQIVIEKGLTVSLVLTSENVPEGSRNVTFAGRANTGWVNTTPLTRPAFAVTGNMNGLDWGVEEIPVVNAYSVPRQLNPGGTNRVSVPNAAFTGSDPEDGTYPTGLGGKTVRLWPATNGDVYYNGVRVAAATDFTSFNPTLVTVDPADGNISLSFDYSTYDAASERAVQKKITMPFEPAILISGKVWDDANGDAVKLGGNEPFTNAGGLNAVLVSSSNTVIEVEAVSGTTGAYVFDQAISNSTYSIYITTAAPGLGNPPAASVLPTNWVHTGVNVNNTPNTAIVNGTITSVTTGGIGSAALTDRNFGIEQIPAVNAYTAPRQLNPGGTARVGVPDAAFTGTDLEDGTYAQGLAGKTVRLWPATNGDVYYNGTRVAAATDFAGFNPALVTVDPADGNISLGFDYATYDAAGERAVQKKITMPFEPAILISGTVWNDVNANAINAAPEVFTNAGGLFAVLVSNTNVVLDVSAVNATTGAYSFDQAISATTYKIILSTTAPAVNSSLSASSLPAPATGAWVNTGTNIGGSANVANRTGIITNVTTGAVGSPALANYNFGIEQIPLVTTQTASGRPNPGDTLSVIVPPATFRGSDNDGVVSSIRITAFPTNATSIVVGTTRYYPTAGAVPTSNCPAATCVVFPVSGVTVPANPAFPGQPTTTIRVDPVNGSFVVNIPFRTIDNGNMESAADGAARVPFFEPLPPIAQNIDNEPMNSSVAHTHIGGFVASDPQGDPILSYKVLTLPPPASGILYTCSGNNVPCTGTYTAVTVNQVLTPAQSQTLYFNPDSSFIGTVTFNYNATSKNGVSNTAIETIPVINNPPTANSFTTDPVKRNSSNNPLPPLSGADGDGVVVTYTVTPPIPAQGILTYCTTPPSTGCGTPITTTVTLTPDQVKLISYTPAPDYTGITTFTYTTKDNNNLVSDPATVTIPVTNLGLDPRQLPPVTQNIILAPLNSASPAVNIAELLGSDPDGTIASYKILSLPNAAVGVLYSCTNGTYPCTGTLSAVSVNQVLTPQQAKTLQFDPTAGNNTTPAKFQYNATDNDGLLSNTSTYTIPVMNQPPTAVAIQTRVPFNAINFPVPPLQGIDADGTVTTYRVRSVPDPSTQGTLYSCSNNTSPCTGTYTQVLVNATLTPAQIATLTFTPVTGFVGTAEGSYDVQDNNQKWSSIAPIKLKIDNLYQTGQPPVAVGSSYAMGANDGIQQLPGTFIRATDPDGTITSFTITSLPPASQGLYTYCTTPPSTSCSNPLTVGLVLTPAQAAALRFTPEPTYSGPSYLGFFATDNDGNPSNLAVSVVDVTSKPPIATGYTTATVKSGGAPIQTPLLAHDRLDNGTVVMYTITSIPDFIDGSLSYCSNPPSTGCSTPVEVGTTLTPAQAATVRFTPGADISVHEVVFNFTATDNSRNLSNVASIVVPVMDPTLCIKVRAYLEGALTENGNQIAPDGRPLMRDNLRRSPFNNATYIPSADPYEFPTDFVDIASRYTKLAPQTSDYPVFQQVMDQSVFGVSGQNAIVDWAFVELRNKSNNAIVSATRAGLIQRDGDIVDVDGVGCLAFPEVPIDSYYVSVRHRSHLGTMTKYGQSAANLQSLVDLTVPSTPLFERTNVPGFNYTGLAQKEEMIGTYRAMWQGDFDGDGKIKYDNPNDDLAVMLFDVRLYPDNTTLSTNYDFAYGYRQGDFDMNSKTKFDNPNDDNANLLFQVRLYPLNINLTTNFDFFLQQLP